MVILHCILRYKSSELNWVQRFGEKLFEAKNTAIVEYSMRRLAELPDIHTYFKTTRYKIFPSKALF